MANFCSKCGMKLDDAFEYCSKCGTVVHNERNNKDNREQANQYAQKTPTKILADREHICAVVWIVIASVQGVSAISAGGLLSWFGELIDFDLGYSVLPMLGLAAYNGYGAYCSFQMVKRIRSREKGIVAEYDKTLIPCIIAIAANVLLGSVIGIAGAVFELFNRNYALSNADYLEE